MSPGLLALRRQKLLTQAELATLADVSEATIRNIENGYKCGRILRPRTMRKIAKALDVRPADIDEFGPSLGREQVARPAELLSEQLAAAPVAVRVRRLG